MHCRPHDSGRLNTWLDLFVAELCAVDIFVAELCAVDLFVAELCVTE